MNMQAKLKAAIAKTANASEKDITDHFSLDIQKFQSSAGSVILSNIVKKIYKQKIDCSGIKTFGELVVHAESSDNRDKTLITEQKKIETIPEVSTGNALNIPVSENSNPPINIPGVFSCGIDIQDISVFPETDDYWTEPFYQENFTGEEIAYCATTGFPRQHFAARWCIKEALRKNGPAFLSLPFNNIRVRKWQDGSVFIETYSDGVWRRIAASCSMSHSDRFAVGMVIVYE
jgi:phosphopantetheine--protein transferase-like protein